MSYIDKVAERVVCSMTHILDGSRWHTMTLKERVESVWFILRKKDIRLSANRSNSTRQACFKKDGKSCHVTVSYESEREYSLKINRKNVVSSDDPTFIVAGVSIQNQYTLINGKVKREICKNNVLCITRINSVTSCEEIIELIYSSSNTKELQQWVEIIEDIIRACKKRAAQKYVTSDNSYCKNCNKPTQMTFDRRSGDTVCTACGVVASAHAISIDSFENNPYGESFHSLDDSDLMQQEMLSTAPYELCASMGKKLSRFEHADTMEKLTSTYYKNIQKANAFNNIDNIRFAMALPEKVALHAKRIFSELRDSYQHMYLKESHICACVVRAYVSEYGNSSPDERSRLNGKYKCSEGRWMFRMPNFDKAAEVPLSVRIKRKLLCDKKKTIHKTSLRFVTDECDKEMKSVFMNDSKTSEDSSLVRVFEHNGMFFRVRDDGDEKVMIPCNAMSFCIESVSLRNTDGTPFCGTFFVQIRFGDKCLFETPHVHRMGRTGSIVRIKEPVLYKTNETGLFDLIVLSSDCKIIGRVDNIKYSNVLKQKRILRTSLTLDVGIKMWLPTLVFKKSACCKRLFPTFASFKRHANVCYFNDYDKNTQNKKKRKRSSLYDAILGGE